MQEYPVRVYRVTVIFNTKNLPPPDSPPPPPSDPSNPITLLCDDFIVDEALNGKNLSIPQGMTLIAFDLLQLPIPAADDPKAVFGTTGDEAGAAGTIMWTAPGDTGSPPTPVTPSRAYEVQPFFPSHCTIIDINTDKVQNKQAFRVFVFYEGTGIAYNSDPTIVNEPPMQPGG